MRSLLGNDRPVETERKIKANDREYNGQFGYANNYIKTSKYSILTFAPLNLFEQFQRLANFYFLCLLILQLIPIISSLTPITTAVPLLFVLSITALKDAYDDYQRHRSDSRVNGRKAAVLRDGKMQELRWCDVQVGDIIRLQNSQPVTADLFVLGTSEPNGLCYIETAELDGETNLKIRQAIPELEGELRTEEQLWKFDGFITCEPPNRHLGKFEGALDYKGKKYPIDNDNILLRGCVMKNTEWCYGLVIFAGKDTKLMKNSGKTKFKRTSIDRLMNALILGIVFFLVLMCLFCTIACGIWETVTGNKFRAYLPWDELVPESVMEGATVIAILIFFSYLIALNTVVPISLYVSVELIRLTQSMLINWDRKLFFDEKQVAAKARTTTLNEELGQIEYIFSDKTGTLTKNIMTFNKCSIAMKKYGEIFDANGQPLQIQDDMQTVNMTSNQYSEPSFLWYDRTLIDKLEARDYAVTEFFRTLALCHTVMSETNENGDLSYQAQSPDEGALVSAARNFGYVFLERTPNTITISDQGEKQVYELLCILDFNNVRKRMSVIVRRDNKIKLYCKGADQIIYERLKDPHERLAATTTEHLNEFAGEGLRTLVLASKDLDPQYFADWKRRHYEASVALQNREEILHEVYEEIERDLDLVGASAIEDQLQEGVPATIANLALAGIKIWVLTGDKQETAINIGYSCELLTDEMAEIFIVDGTVYDEVEQQLRKHLETIRSMVITTDKGKLGISVVTFNGGTRDVQFHPAPTNRNRARSEACESVISEREEEENRANTFALVINGHSLVHALHPKMEELFLDVASNCKAVICCRVTPLQKADVVDLVKKYKKAVTLAIGDGANDVSMIKTAHIGVGISGQEGMQAVLSSDYSIGQFRFLERLLLVHGRWSYLRMCKFLRYFFYKNFAFTLSHFWFAFFCGFSAKTIYDDIFISCYNMFYTALPVLAMAVLDQDVGDHYSVKYPKLYYPGIQDLLFNKAEFFKCVLLGIVTSAVLFFVCYGAYYDGTGPNGQVISDLMSFGSALSTILVIVVTIQIALETSYWTVVNAVVIAGSILVYFLLTFAAYYILQTTYLGSLARALSEATFWFTLFLCVTILSLPLIAKRFYFIDLYPTLSDRLRLKQRVDTRPGRMPSDLGRVGSAIRRSRRSLRSGYAFAHQEGFGRLITAGKIMSRRRGRSPAVTAGRGRSPSGSTPKEKYSANTVSPAPTSPAPDGNSTPVRTTSSGRPRPIPEETVSAISTPNSIRL